jgi:hypothetical protein
MCAWAVGVHRASSSSWGDSAGARLCQLVMESNTGIGQQIAENRTDLLDLLTLQQLNEPDDFGLTSLFLCVYYDRPDILTYLHRRGLDVAAVCDPMEYGTPMFYAVSMGRRDCVKRLDQLGVSVELPCDSLNLTPEAHAARIGDDDMKALLVGIVERKHDAARLVTGFFRSIREKKIIQRKQIAVIKIQSLARGIQGRSKASKQRKRLG